MTGETSKRFVSRAQGYLLAGILTAVPIWVTWLIFEFILGRLSNFGMPWVRALARGLLAYAPSVAQWLLAPWFQSSLAVILTLGALYMLGWAATLVVGKRSIAVFDSLMQRIPFVQTIYGSTKKLLIALQQKPDRVHRVVLIEFPSPDMKTVGLVTRILTDDRTGRALAAVYVPTTPNPTSGYLEIVPVEKLISTDWTLDEAMSFIISGGAVAPDKLDFTGVPSKGKHSVDAGRVP